MIGVLAPLFAGAAACSDGEPAAPTEPPDLVSRYGLTPMPAMLHPPGNSPDSARIALGKLIFFDPIQSGGRDVACATCHLPRFGFTDGRDLPAGPSGVGFGPDRVLTDPAIPFEGRNSPTIINVGFNRFGAQETPDGFLFWDGRKRRLENLVTLPQREVSEMRGNHYPVEDALDTVLTRLRSIPEYEARFRAAFPERAADIGEGVKASVIDSATLSMALAQFVRSVKSTGSAYDRFVAGDANALTDAQRRGLVLFHEEAGCVRCHTPPLFSDYRFHVVGARQNGPGFQGTPHDDPGRWVATRLDVDRYRFRTPSLRNVALTAPYTHSGAYETLRDMVEFFNHGGGDHPRIDPARIEVAPLGLSQSEIDDIIAFL
ncbi:MAG: cytochrome-c peroxidase, partial [Planctomycetaceae bacterium]